MKSLCGADCSSCQLNGCCGGCVETEGRPFGEKCVTAELCKKGGNALCEFKKKMIDAFNSLGIEDMPKVSELYALKGSFINMDLPLPNGNSIKFWNDDRIYLGNQLEKLNSDRCYGIAGDENYIMVCEYGKDGTDAQLILFRRWN